jgi:pimeloyl-ACP methyl ester carboxylesterase
VGLVLPGYACTSQIWRLVRPELDADFDITWVDWPREFTPGFHTVEAFASWLRRTIRLIDYDFMVGHSMGGLVALELAKKDRGFLRQIILIESFLQSPAPFFQNIFLEKSPEREERLIREMLDREKAFYSPNLREALQHIDVSRAAASLEPKLDAVYGDRGCEEQGRVQQELAWPSELRNRVEVSVVPDACHFPMIENSRMTAQLLRDILK